MRSEIFEICFHEMLFVPIDTEIIYVESGYGGISWLFDKYWREIDNALNEKYDICFRYLPKLEDVISEEQIKWFAPSLDEENIKHFKNPFSRHTSAELSHYIVENRNINIRDMVPVISLDKWHLPPGLIMHNQSSSYQNDFLYIPIPQREIGNPEDIIDVCVKCAQKLITYNFGEDADDSVDTTEVGTVNEKEHDDDNFGALMFSISRDLHSDADDRFNRDVEKLLDEARLIIDRLRIEGVSEIVINRLLSHKSKLSPLLITSDYRLMLTDYNIEIVMRPLVKAVYLLFLRHPEGILFKSLPDYRQELADIYKRLRGGELSSKEQQSIDKLINPIDNSINEKCARIRESFLVKINDTLTEVYMVSGMRGEPKRIELHHSMVQWDRPLDDIPLTERVIISE